MEEVVVAEDYSINKQEDEAEMITVVNEHDYVEVPAEGGYAQVVAQMGKKPRLMDEEVVDFVEEELERKPVVSPIVQVPSSISQVKQEAGQVSVIRRLAPPMFAPSLIPGSMG